MYEYQAAVVRVKDGDTLVLQVDLGLDCARTIDCRLWGIDAAEIATPLGKAARSHLVSLLSLQPLLLVRTIEDRTDKYGRWLVLIHDPGQVAEWDVPGRGLPPTPDEFAVTINARMITDQYALGYYGKGPRPVHSTEWPDAGASAAPAGVGG